MKNRKIYPDSGITLIELMVTVSVVAILAAIAAPLYKAQQLKGGRGEAIQALTQIHTELERCYGRNGGFDCCDDNIAPKTFPGSENSLYKILPTNNTPTDTLYQTPDGNYEISITMNNIDTGFVSCKQAQGYELKINTVTNTRQDDDTCKEFTIDNTGKRTATKTSCWSD